MRTLEELAAKVYAAYLEWSATEYWDSDNPDDAIKENNRDRNMKWLVYQRLRDEYEQVKSTAKSN